MVPTKAGGGKLSTSATSNWARLGEEVNGEWLVLMATRWETMHVPCRQVWPTAVYAGEISSGDSDVARPVMMLIREHRWPCEAWNDGGVKLNADTMCDDIQCWMKVA